MAWRLCHTRTASRETWRRDATRGRRSNPGLRRRRRKIDQDADSQCGGRVCQHLLLLHHSSQHLAGHEDYKEICEDARLEDRAHWELIVPRIYELGSELPNDLKAFHDQTGCTAAKLPDPPTVVNILTLLLESERCAIRSWSAVCDVTFGKDPRTYDMAARILNEEIEHEAWFIELLAKERDGKSIPSGHFRRGEPGHAPYSKNAGFYNP